MGGEEDGHLRLMPQPLHRLPHRAARLRIETRRRFVQKEQLGRVDEPARDVRPPPLSAAQLPEGAVEDVGKGKHLIELCKPLFPRSAAHAVKSGARQKVLAHGEPVVEHRLLEDDAHPPLNVLRPLVEVEAADGDSSFVLGQNGAEDVDGRALARAVDAEEGKEAPLLHTKGDAVDGLRLAV